MNNKYPMFNSESDDSRESVVWVSDDERLTVPKWVQEELEINTPGEARFRKTKSGTIVIERTPSGQEMRGFAKRHGEATTDKPATQLLRESRDQDKRDLDARFDLTDE